MAAKMDQSVQEWFTCILGAQ